jgi:hypothetical protein
MRALTVEELEFVSGGFGFTGPTPTPEEPPVVVTGRRIRPGAVAYSTWEEIRGMDQLSFCNNMESEFRNALTESAIQDGYQGSNGAAAGFGVMMVGGGFVVCGAGTVSTGGLGLIPSCAGGALVSATGGLVAAASGLGYVAATINEASALRDSQAIRTSAVRAGCSASSF